MGRAREVGPFGEADDLDTLRLRARRYRIRQLEHNLALVPDLVEAPAADDVEGCRVPLSDAPPDRVPRKLARVMRELSIERSAHASAAPLRDDARHGEGRVGDRRARGEAAAGELAVEVGDEA